MAILSAMLVASGASARGLEALATAAGISGGSARTVPTLLLPEESRFRNPILLYSPKRTEDEVIDGLDCYRIEDPSDYRNLTLWIDKEKFLLLKIYTMKRVKFSYNISGR